jgi:hypothetical protein
MKVAIALLLSCMLLSACTVLESALAPSPTKSANQFPQWSPSWTKFFADSSNNQWYIDLDRQRYYTNGTTRVSVMEDLSKKGDRGEFSRLTVWLIDCQVQRIGLVDFARFSGPRGTGSVISHNQGNTTQPRDWKEVQKDTIAEGIVQLACPRR